MVDTITKELDLSKKQIMFIDGSYNIKGSGVRILIDNEYNLKFEVSIRYQFPNSNNQGKYEACLVVLLLAFTKRVQNSHRKDKFITSHITST